MFYTPKGALSPVAGTVEPKNGYGTLDAQYIVSFTGTLATGVKQTGCIGVKNYGGTVADVLWSSVTVHQTDTVGEVQYFSVMQMLFTEVILGHTNSVMTKLQQLVT